MFWSPFSITPHALCLIVLYLKREQIGHALFNSINGGTYLELLCLDLIKQMGDTDVLLQLLYFRIKRASGVCDMYLVATRMHAA